MMLSVALCRLGATASWSAPVPWRFRSQRHAKSARGLAHSKTWRRVATHPKVARSSQPWAERWNPLGILGTAACETGELWKRFVYSYHRAGPRGADRSTRTVEAGFFSSFAGGRIGRRTSSPPQFGHTKPSFFDAHARQKVHSNVQM